MTELELRASAMLSELRIHLGMTHDRCAALAADLAVANENLRKLSALVDQQKEAQKSPILKAVD